MDIAVETILYVSRAVVAYATNSHIITSHIIGISLLLWIRRTRPDQVCIYGSLLAGELFTITFWLCLPDAGWSAILATALWIHLYESLAGPRAKIEEHAVFIATTEFTKILEKSSELLTFEPWDHPSRSDTQILVTSVQYVDQWASYFHRPWAKTAVNLDDVTEMHEGMDPEIAENLQRTGIEVGVCFYLDIGSCRRVTYICSDEQLRDVWLSGIVRIAERKVELYHEDWLMRLLEDCSLEHILDTGATLEDVLILLDRARRPVNKSYIKEIFYTFARASSIKYDDLRLDATQFRRFFHLAIRRPEIHEIYNRILYKRRGEVALSAHRLKEFMECEQQEDVTLEQCQRWISDNETLMPSNNFSIIGFTNFMLSDDQQAFHRVHRQVFQDMSHPLSHYYIATSHNTYLTKDQVKGKSSVTAYISALQRGCKCVELDIWDGPNNEPIIYHGHTLTSKILFKDVVRAIEEHAFDVSDYPVLLSFENHCSIEQQKVMATYLRDILGDKLYLKPIPDDEDKTPSPEDLRNYILIKNKKLVEGGEADEYNDESSFEDDSDTEEKTRKDSSTSTASVDTLDVPSTPTVIVEENHISSPLDVAETHVNGTADHNDNTKEGEYDDTTFNEDESQEGGRRDSTLLKKWTLRRSKKSSRKKCKIIKVAQELSDLVVYCQAVHFKGFDDAITNQKYYQMSSISENKSIRYVKEQPVQFATYTQGHLCRVYPAGRRVDSSNLEPMALWGVGCQLVALNYQTPDRPMHLNQGLFADNGGCGYVLKPEFLRTDKISFDVRGPYNADTVRYLTIKLISGYQIPYPKEEKVKNERALNVQIRITGVDTDRRKSKTKSIRNNGYNPVWNESFTFSILVPELTMITFTVREGDTFLGHISIPFTALQMGFRILPLQSKECEPLPFGSLFIHSHLAEKT